MDQSTVINFAHMVAMLISFAMVILCIRVIVNKGLTDKGCFALLVLQITSLLATMYLAGADPKFNFGNDWPYMLGKLSLTIFVIYLVIFNRQDIINLTGIPQLPKSEAASDNPKTKTGPPPLIKLPADSIEKEGEPD